MKNILRFGVAVALTFVLALVAGCNRDEPVIPSTALQVVYPDPEPGDIKGFFVLNEGNMGTNKASLDYFDYTEGKYHRNIFPERNPTVVHELGDVGNDLQIYDGRLWAVINCSDFVRVMDVRTARQVGTFSVPNCRYIVFDGAHAYVSSYAGPVQTGADARIGKVVKVDIATLSVVGECNVGYQPEEMVVAGDMLYVANSGGYRAPDYDRTVSVIDLATFTEMRKIDVAINLHSLELDRYGQIWVSSGGDHKDVPPRTYVIDSATDEVTLVPDLPGGRMARHDDMLYVHSYSDATQTSSYAVVDTRTRQVVARSFITDGTGGEIKVPYGLAVNPANGDVVVTDARDYVTPGTLHCYGSDGVRRWSTTAGDIPAHIAFTTTALLPLGLEPEPEPDGPTAYITRVIDFMPAAGQFTNKYPAWAEGDTQQTMNDKVLAAIGGNRRSLISLGGWGGYVVVGFDHTIENVSGLCDFRVLGNAFRAQTGGSSEPGVIMVSRDVNGNGIADDEWYEIAGSAHADPATRRDYEITYFRPDTAEEGVCWEDNIGGTGVIPRNEFHTQPYFPQWATGERLTFRGTRLPQNATGGVMYGFDFGYADNVPNADPASAIDIDLAVDAAGQPAGLSGVDFIKVYTGVNQHNGPTGECSTEITGIEDLHLLGIEIDTL
jgi:DNA-binding beta-propeller fold protein YncE